MGLISLNLKDIGGQPLVYDTVRGAIEQDPSVGGTNVYGPGDVFVSPSGAYVDYHTALSQAMVSVGRLTNANPSSSPAVVTNQKQTTTPSPSSADPWATAIRPNILSGAGGDIGASVQDALNFLLTPTGMLLAGGAAAFLVLRKRRR